MKLRVGFTGTKNGMDDLQKINLAVLFTTLKNNHSEIEFHHGDCIGADAQAAQIARQFGFRLVAHPGFPPNHPEVTQYRAFTTLNDEVREPKPFISRDHDIVDETDEMVAAPVSEKEERASGTWTTVRYARKKEKKVTVINPKKTPKFDPHALPARTNAVSGETNLYGPTHRQRGIR